MCLCLGECYVVRLDNDIVYKLSAAVISVRVPVSGVCVYIYGED